MSIPTMGVAWNTTHSKAVITYSFAELPLYTSFAYQYADYPVISTVFDATQKTVFNKALEVWEQAVNVDFILVADSTSVQLRVGMGRIDGTGSTLAETSVWNKGNVISEAAIDFDISDMSRATLSTSSPPPGVVSLFQTSLHEIGHVLGLEHSTVSTDLMYPYANQTVTLSADDKAAVASMYGTPDTGTKIDLSSISSTTATNICQLVQAMFDASPGAGYLSQFANYLGAGYSMGQLAKELETTSLFNSSDLYPSFLSNDQFATRFVDNLLGNTVSSSARGWAISQVDGILEAGKGRGDSILWASTALASVPSSDLDFGAAAQQFRNKVEVSEYFSFVKGIVSNDLPTLQSITAAVTSDAATVATAIAGLAQTS